MLYFENRQLKKEIKTLDRDLDYHKRERESAERKVNELERNITAQKDSYSKLEKQRDKYKKLVRQQTGADLLVNALIELGVVPKPEPEYDAYARQNALLQQLGGQQSAYGQAQQAGLANIFGGTL